MTKFVSLHLDPVLHSGLTVCSRLLLQHRRVPTQHALPQVHFPLCGHCPSIRAHAFNSCQADASNGAVTGIDAGTLRTSSFMAGPSALILHVHNAPGTFEKYLSTCNTLHIDV